MRYDHKTVYEKNNTNKIKIVHAHIIITTIEHSLTIQTYSDFCWKKHKSNYNHVRLNSKTANLII